MFLKNGVKEVDFYIKGFGAVELRRFANDDGSIHISELSIEGAVFHLHEVTENVTQFNPEKHNGITTLIGLFVPDVDGFMSRAIAAGAKEISPAQSYDYGYRQGKIKDPYGHQWLIEMKI